MTQQDEQKKDPSHWIADEGNRRAFWVKVKDEFGLTEEQVHAALEKESLYDVTSSRQIVESQLRWYAKGLMVKRAAQEAIGVLLEWRTLLDSQAVTDSLAGLAEAPASINTHICTPSGYNAQVTLRDTNEAQLFKRFQQATEAFEQLGFFPCNRFGDPVVTVAQGAVQQAVQEQATHDQPSTPPAGAPPRPTGPPQPASGLPPGNGAPQGNGGGVSIRVDTITPATTQTGKRCYKVRGERLQRHGVTGWPEVVEPAAKAFAEGYDISQLDINTQWDVSGYRVTAICEQPPDKDWPTKVIRLEWGS